MRTGSFVRWSSVLIVLALLLSACGGNAPAASGGNAPAAGATAAPAAGGGATTEGKFQIPAVEDGKFNIAMVLIGPHDDGGWSQAHYEGLQFVEKNVANVHTAYVENVPEGADSEQVFRSLSRKGFNLILGTSFGFMDPMATVAEEFPKITYVHISGFKTNNKNFGNLFGAMESMKYLAGMLAGARAKKDGNPKLGYMATFPIPEELRLGNAFALGMRKTCPECTLDVRWINTWHDPVKEKEGAASLFDAGAQVVFTGADTPASADVAQEKGKWGITYDWAGGCKVERCLTAPYWNWGPIYAKVAKGVQDGSYKVGYDYFDADSGGLGLYGFMEGQQPTKGVADLPPEVIQQVKDTLAKMQKGEFTRFDVFSGPIKDNTGKEVVPAGAKLEQGDLDQFDKKSGCKFCMYWWAEGVSAELPKAS
ncbi:MAG TPA: BMP family ABC transporter substrate-binding protein [Kouleothrix sp.]|uniref:BMP family ABC transporter substrate-binding protein n=1 Tax=Kouleothrix sp. TaxID=2779161 RepID=UPI002C573069|nr:BMP family ABC transporter substrate-binding protein [Kouleothrix sp.]